jgi:hypothetical protein
MDAYALGTGNFSTTKAGLSAGTTTTVTTANTQLFSIRGKSYTKAGTSNEAAPTTDAASGAAFVGVTINKGCVFTICRDASANLKVVQGQIVDLDSGAGFVYAPQFGPQLDTLAPIGYLLIKVASNGSTWTFGSSNTSGVTGVTYTWVDVNLLPDRPQIS